jgi:hypothetical protein
LKRQSKEVKQLKKKKEEGEEERKRRNFKTALFKGYAQIFEAVFQFSSHVEATAPNFGLFVTRASI